MNFCWMTKQNVYHFPGNFQNISAESPIPCHTVFHPVPIFLKESTEYHIVHYVHSSPLPACLHLCRWSLLLIQFAWCPSRERTTKDLLVKRLLNSCSACEVLAHHIFVSTCFYVARESGCRAGCGASSLGYDWPCTDLGPLQKADHGCTADNTVRYGILFETPWALASFLDTVRSGILSGTQWDLTSWKSVCEECVESVWRQCVECACMYIFSIAFSVAM